MAEKLNHPQLNHDRGRTVLDELGRASEHLDAARAGDGDAVAHLAAALEHVIRRMERDDSYRREQNDR